MGRGHPGTSDVEDAQRAGWRDFRMPTMVKLGLVLLASIFAVLLVFLVIGNMIGGPGTDSDNSDVHSNSVGRL
jgi:hypothetical protein